jgi:hypothetical protein
MIKIFIKSSNLDGTVPDLAKEQRFTVYLTTP